MSEKSLLPLEAIPSGSVFTLSENKQAAVIQPEIIQKYFSVSETSKKEIIQTRNLVCDVIKNLKNYKTPTNKAKTPLLVITGPEYITDEQQAIMCSKWINNLNKFDKIDQLQNVKISMRANLYKICYPSREDSHHTFSDSLKQLKSRQSFSVSNGLTKSRDLLVKIANNHVSIVGQITDNITPQYFSDLYSVSFLSASSLESQVHREIVSGMSYPVGLETSLNEKNDHTYCQIKRTLLKDTIMACSNKHRFLSVTKQGQIAVAETIGNDDSFILLKINNILGLDIKSFRAMLNDLIDKSLDAPILFELGAIENTAMFELAKNLINNLLTNIAENRIKILGFSLDSGTQYNSNLETGEIKKINLNNNQDYQQISAFVNKMLYRRSREKLKYNLNTDPSSSNFKKIFENFDYLEMQKILETDSDVRPKDSSNEKFNIDEETEEYSVKSQNKSINSIRADDTLLQPEINNQSNKIENSDSISEADGFAETEKVNLEFFKRILGAEQFDKLFGQLDISQEDVEKHPPNKHNKSETYVQPKELSIMSLSESAKFTSALSGASNKNNLDTDHLNLCKNLKTSAPNSINSMNNMISNLSSEKEKDYVIQSRNNPEENTKRIITTENELYKQQIFANELIKYINRLQEKLK